MTNEESMRIGEGFERLQKDILAVLANQEILKAEVRAFRDAMMSLQDRPKVTSDELYREYAKRFEEYCATIQTDSEKVLERVARTISDARQSGRE
jgi:hypothetical protein